MHNAFLASLFIASLTACGTTGSSSSSSGATSSGGTPDAAGETKGDGSATRPDAAGAEGGSISGDVDGGGLECTGAFSCGNGVCKCDTDGKKGMSCCDPDDPACKDKPNNCNVFCCN
jgi:hypothetical protein